MTLHRSALALAAVSALACGKSPAPSPTPPAPAPQAVAAPIPAAPPSAPAPAVAVAVAGDGLRVTSFERSLLDPLLEDLRKGVRPVDDKALGLCSSSGKDCTEFLGAAPGELPAGKYVVKADLKVPRLGDKGTWTVAFEVKCTTTTSGTTTTTSTNVYNRTFEVSHSTQERGYRLMPLYAIESPSKGGSRRCDYTITAPHPDGARVHSGSWSVPQAT